MSKAAQRKKGRKLIDIQLFQQTWKTFINGLDKFLNYLKERPKAWGFLLLLLICIGIVVLGILPSENNFEGSLVVKEIRFTYNGQPNKLFINSINGIKRLEVKGRQTETLILKGKFSSSLDSELNQKLTKLDTLKIELPDDKSQWMIFPADSKLESKLKLIGLKLLPQTTINSLSYDPNNNRLDFSLKPEVVANKPETDNLFINLGDQPLKIICSNCELKLPELDLQDSSKNSNEIKLIYQPNIPDISLSINTETYFSIDLPDPSQVNYEELLRGDLTVKNVEFNKVDSTGIDLKDDLEKSTIIKGDIRMREQELKIESNQFLMIGEPGIERLRHLAIIPPKTTPEVELRINGESVEISEPVEGIEARIAGKAKRIQVGIDPRFPVNSIQSNYLASWGLSKDLIISIIPFLLGVIVSLLTWLVNDFLSWLKPNSTSSPNTVSQKP